MRETREHASGEQHLWAGVEIKAKISAKMAAKSTSQNRTCYEIKNWSLKKTGLQLNSVYAGYACCRQSETTLVTLTTGYSAFKTIGKHHNAVVMPCREQLANVPKMLALQLWFPLNIHSEPSRFISTHCDRSIHAHTVRARIWWQQQSHCLCPDPPGGQADSPGDPVHATMTRHWPQTVFSRSVAIWQSLHLQQADVRPGLKKCIKLSVGAKLCTPCQ